MEIYYFLRIFLIFWKSHKFWWILGGSSIIFPGNLQHSVDFPPKAEISKRNFLKSFEIFKKVGNSEVIFHKGHNFRRVFKKLSKNFGIFIDFFKFPINQLQLFQNFNTFLYEMSKNPRIFGITKNFSQIFPYFQKRFQRTWEFPELFRIF